MPATPDYDDPPDFAAWLEDQRQERGWTQEALARQLDMSLSGLRSWLYGRSEPVYAQLYKVWVLFGELPWDES
jgi:ribosome-binding protein aMBF1 (putative translation factor)